MTIKPLIPVEDTSQTISRLKRARTSAPLAPNSASKVQIFRHDGDPSRVDSAKVGILKQPNKVGLCSLLECQYGLTLEADVLLELSRDFSHETLEGKPADE
jgi:hypothetical protein